MDTPTDHLTPFDRLAASKEARRVIIELRAYAAENDLDETERAELLALVVQTLNRSHL